MSGQSTASAEEDVLEINGSLEGGPAGFSLSRLCPCRRADLRYLHPVCIDVETVGSCQQCERRGGRANLGAGVRVLSGVNETLRAFGHKRSSQHARGRRYGEGVASGCCPLESGSNSVGTVEVQEERGEWEQEQNGGDDEGEKREGRPRSTNMRVMLSNNHAITHFRACLDPNYLALPARPLRQSTILYYFDQFVFDSEFLIQLKSKRNPTNREKIIAAIKKNKQNLTRLRIVSVTSDGETRRGKAFIDLTFDHLLSDDSDIYDLLKDLEFMDFWVGKDDLTPDKDHKHMFKRGRNRLTRALGMKIFGVQITPAILRVHFQSAGLSSQHIHAILNPDDKQDVKLAFDLLKDIWSLPPAPADSRPGFASAREAVRIIGSLFYHLLFPYVCVDLTLSEQLEHLSAAAHLLLLLYRDGQKDTIPTLLYTDIMIMIKNAYFCVAKAKLVERITGSTEVANILAMYPHWDRPPRRLQLPTLARDSSVLPDRADHIKPPSWRGDTTVANVTPLTCWNRGRRIIEQECPQLAKHFRALDASYNVNILSPLGELIVHKELDLDDNEDDDEEVAVAKSSVSPDLEDAAIDEDVLVDTAPVFTNFITVQDKPLRKTRALALMQKFGYNAKSTDRLKRVADVQRYSAKGNEHAGTVIESDAAYILVSEPIATLVRCEEKLFVGIGEVTDIQLDGKSLEQLSVDSLRERKVTVHFQILSLVPATDQDAPEGKHDWRSTGILRHVLSTPGRLVLPVDPAVSTRIPGKPYYLVESGVLRALGAQLLDEVTLGLNSHIPKCTPTPRFPYREPSGLACFVCEGENDLHGIEESDSHMCLKCTPPVVLDVTHPQTVLTHIGAHILHDSTVDRSTQPCGFFCRPFAICHFALKKTADGMTVELDASKGCSNFVKKFNYGVAAKSTKNSPCSNVPLRCPECDRTDPSIWRYNLKEHLARYHPLTPVSRYRELWELTESESTAMRVVWEKLQVPRKKKTAKKPKATLAISAAHSSRLALIDEQDEVDSDESSFINDSPIQTPEPSDNEDDMLGQPMPSGGDNLERPADLSAERPPSPLEYFPEPDALRNHIIAAGFSAHPESDRRDSSASIDTPTGIAADRTDSGSTQQPSTAASEIPFPSQDPLLSVPSETLLASIQPPNPAPPVLTDPGTRRSNRKRKERDGLEDLAAALEACICGSSAAPEDESEYPNVARCKNEGCETKWYHLRCLEHGSVAEGWVCEACLRLVTVSVIATSRVAPASNRDNHPPPAVEHVFSHGPWLFHFTRNHMSVPSFRCQMSLGSWDRKGLLRIKELVDACTSAKLKCKPSKLRNRGFTRTGFVPDPRRVRFWRVRVQVELAVPAGVPVTNLKHACPEVAVVPSVVALQGTSPTPRNIKRNMMCGLEFLLAASGEAVPTHSGFW
ncbi:hypothetical protein DFH08DRAFT_939956 [Mycena albidolilacea]|uniref:Zinc finger PHD-type domain-containing protein n=1 Tax=Mycena albidolilacea TaxID=1033008 RepID=A0AAD7EK38_9AGAR|nr:hypothetical protein DFH08DRAFT_939956 [Mycena albidolilacea]